MDMFTWDYLATAAGAAAAVTLLTQFSKSISFINKLPTQLVSYIIAFVIMFAAAVFTGMLTVEYAALIPLNAVIVMLASNGTYNTITNTKTGNNNNEQTK